MTAVIAPIASVVSCGTETSNDVHTTRVGNILVPAFHATTTAGPVEYIVGQTPAITSINGHDVSAGHVAQAKVDVDALMKQTPVDLQPIIDLIADIGTGATTTLVLEGHDVSLAGYATNKVAQTAVNKWVEEGLKAAFPNSLVGTPVGALDLGVLDMLAETHVELPAKGSRFHLPSSFPEAPIHTRWVAQCKDLAGEKWAPLTAFMRPAQDRTLLVPNAADDTDFVPTDAADTQKLQSLAFTVKLEALGTFRLLKPLTYTIIYEAPKAPA